MDMFLWSWALYSVKYSFSFGEHLRWCSGLAPGHVTGVAPGGAQGVPGMKRMNLVLTPILSCHELGVLV